MKINSAHLNATNTIHCVAEKDKRAKEHGRKGKVTMSVKRSRKRKKKINMKRQKGKTFRRGELRRRK